jgi:hypothetical protein
MPGRPRAGHVRFWVLAYRHDFALGWYAEVQNVANFQK